MRLLHIDSLELTEYRGAEVVPRYVTASHRWLDRGEATFQDMERKQHVDSGGFQKVIAFAEFAKANIPTVTHLWCDTVCINKESTADLSEAVNLMFEWYHKADICVAHLADVESANDYRSFEASEWFRRGWTLQELLAPRVVIFVTRTWQVIGNKGASRHHCNATTCGPGLEDYISKATGIPEHVLYDYDASLNSSVEEKMKWMESRKTTREEDMFYALYGIFRVSPGANYGERRDGARQRLRMAIYQKMYLDGLPGMEIPLPSRPHRMDAIFSAVEEGDFLELKTILRDHPSAVSAFNDKGQTALHLAAKIGNAEMVRYLLRSDAKVDPRDDDGRIPLHYAVVANSADVTRALMKNGADKYAGDSRDASPRDLCKASSLVAWILDHGPDLTAKDKDEFTALGKFANLGDVKAVRALLTMGADIEGIGRRQHSALFEAVQQDNEEVVQILLASGADMHKRDYRQNTPLVLAGWNGKARNGELLLDYGADINASNELRFTALHECLDHNRLDMALMLLQRGADLQLENSFGYIPLHIAVRHGYIDLVRAMLDLGCDINSLTGDHGYDGGYRGSSLAIASCYGHSQIVDLLLSRGAIVDLGDSEGYTPLCRAAQNNALDCVRMLLAAGANVEARNRDGWTPLHEASRYNQPLIVELLLSRGATIDSQDAGEYTPLHRAIENGALSCAHMLLTAGADIEKNHHGYTPLHEACHHNRPAIVGLLLLRGAFVNPRDGLMFTPLCRAARHGSLECIHMLLTAGADIAIPNHTGWTAVHEAACRQGQAEFIRVLLKHGIEHGIHAAELRDHDGYLPLHRAAQSGCTDAVICLLDNSGKIDINAVEHNGWTALAEACHHDRPDVVRILLDRGAKKDIRVRKPSGFTARDLGKGHRECLRILDSYP